MNDKTLKKPGAIHHRLYPLSFLGGLPEIPVVPQGFLWIWWRQHSLIDRLIEVKSLPNRMEWGQRHSSERRRVFCFTTNYILDAAPKHTWPAGSAHSRHHSHPLEKLKEGMSQRKQRKLSLKWARYSLHNPPSKEFRLFNTVLECTICWYICIYTVYCH